MQAENRQMNATASMTEDFGQKAELPSRLRLLCVGDREPSWTSLTLQIDAEGCAEPRFRWVSTATEALAKLRNESFDCILVSDELSPLHDEPEGEAFALIQAIRASGCDDPIILLTADQNDHKWVEACRHNCELLTTRTQWESLALVPMIKRAISRVELVRDNHHLSVAHHRRLVRERDEAEHLLGQQRQIIQELEEVSGSKVIRDRSFTDAPQEGSTTRLELPEQINSYYHELLRTYVIMGSGGLGTEIAKLSELLAVAGFSPRETLELHLERVESLVRGLGNRSTRHVMARADLLALELMIHLGECYQRMRQSMLDNLSPETTPGDSDSSAASSSRAA